MYKIFLFSVFTIAMVSCSNGSDAKVQKVKDSVENKELESVETMIQSEDSLIEAKKKELGL